MAAKPDLLPSGRSFDNQWWVRAAQNAIRRDAGWHVAPSFSETLRLDGYGGTRLLLPSKHVTEISEIRVDGEAVRGYSWSEAGTVEYAGGWPDRPGCIEVDLTHGWDADEVPEIAALILAIGKRARSMPGVASQSVNGASVAYHSAGGAPLAVPLLQIERDQLAPYRLNWGVA